MGKGNELMKHWEKAIKLGKEFKIDGQRAQQKWIKKNLKMGKGE